MKYKNNVNVKLGENILNFIIGFLWKEKRNLTCFSPAAFDCINIAKKKIYSICAMEERSLSQGIRYYEFKKFLRSIMLFFIIQL